MHPLIVAKRIADSVMYLRVEFTVRLRLRSGRDEMKPAADVRLLAVACAGRLELARDVRRNVARSPRQRPRPHPPTRAPVACEKSSIRRMPQGVAAVRSSTIDATGTAEGERTNSRKIRL